MVWHPTRTWVVDEDVTDTFLNNYLRDNEDDLDQRTDRSYLNGTAGAFVAGDVVVLDLTTAGQVLTTTTLSDSRPVRVVSEAIAANPGAGRCRGTGAIPAINVVGPVAIGDYLVTSTTAKRAIVGTTNAFAQAETACGAGNNTIYARIIRPSGGTVTSVGLSMPAEFNVASSPITGAGTIAVTKAAQLANYFYVAPDGSAGVATFRALVAGDIPGGILTAAKFANFNANEVLVGPASGAATTPTKRALVYQDIPGMWAKRFLLRAG